MKSPDFDAEVLRVLRRHVGRGAAIPAKGVARELGRVNDDSTGRTIAASSRIVKAAVRSLVERHGLPIASGPRGFYIPANDQEVEEEVEALRSRIVSSFREIAALNYRALPEILGEGVAIYGRTRDRKGDTA